MPVWGTGSATQRPSIRVLVAGSTPVDRSLVRHFLQGQGFEVVGEAARPEEVVRLVGPLAPDAVVLDADLFGESLPTAWPVRSASPDSKIVVLAEQGSGEPGALGADAVLEKGPGFGDLASALWLLTAPSQPEPTGEVAGVVPLVRPSDPLALAEKTKGYEPHRLRRLLAVAEDTPPEPRDEPVTPRPLAAAAFAFVVLLIVAAVAGSRLFVPERETAGPIPSPAAPSPLEVVIVDDAERYLGLAQSHVGDLIEAMRDGREIAAARLARELLAARGVVRAAGLSTAEIDALIADQVPGLLDRLSGDAALTLLAILDPLLPGVEAPGARFGPHAGRCRRT